MKPLPFVLRDDRRRAVSRFATYAEAERAASKRCKSLRAAVPVYRRRTHIATVHPCAERGLLIFLTMAGSKIL
ncbi:hypothetical protein HW537_13040 [Asaia siamensis]